MNLTCPRCGARVRIEWDYEGATAICSNGTACGALWDDEGEETEPSAPVPPKPCEHQWQTFTGLDGQYVKCVRCGCLDRERSDMGSVHVFRPGQGWIERG